jgi:hypothetical protein
MLTKLARSVHNNIALLREEDETLEPAVDRVLLTRFQNVHFAGMSIYQPT